MGGSLRLCVCIYIYIYIYIYMSVYSFPHVCLQKRIVLKSAWRLSFAEPKYYTLVSSDTDEEVASRNGIVTVRLRTGWPMNRGSISGRGKKFVSPATRTWAHRASNSVGSGADFLEPEHSPFSITDFKNEWSYNFIPAYGFVACTGASCLCNGEARTDITQNVWRAK